MTLTVDAVYRNGTFAPTDRVSLPEGTHVRLTVDAVVEGETPDPLADVIGIGESGRGDGAAEHDKYLYGRQR